MAVPGSPDLPTTESIQTAMAKKAKKGTTLTLPWILFLLIGIPLGVMAALAPLTAAHIYIEPLRRFWTPWPPDLAKPFIGAAVFVATFAYLVYRSGRIKGFRSGTVAATAAFRNLVEGRGPGQMRLLPPPSSSEAPRALPAPPLDQPKRSELEAPPPLESNLPEDTL